MKQEEQKKIFNEFTSKMSATMFSKAHDYASDDDVLSNFKEVAEAVGILPSQVVRVFIHTKATRLKNLLGSGKKPMNESIADTLMDLCNYAILLEMVLKEENNQ